MDCNKNLFSRANFVLTTHYSFLDELFSYFGAKALSSCSQVCKLWNKISQKEFKRRKNWEVFMQQSEQRKNSFPSFCDRFVNICSSVFLYLCISTYTDTYVSIGFLFIFLHFLFVFVFLLFFFYFSC